MYYRLEYINYTSNNSSDYAFTRRIVIENPNTYSLHSVPIRIVVNDSWFDMRLMNRNMSNIAFIQNTSAELKKLPAYLDYWDGEKAVYYIKIPEIEACGKTEILIAYGNPEANTATWNNEATYLGEIGSMEELSYTENWETINGSINTYYDNNLNMTTIQISTATTKSKIFLKPALCGAINITHKLTTQRFYVTSNTYSYSIIFGYIDEEHYYQLKIFNDSSTGHIAVKITAQNGSENTTIYYGAFSNPINPYQYTVSMQTNTPSGYINTSITCDFETIKINFEDIYSYVSGTWKIGYESNHISEYRIKIDYWKQGIGQPLHIFSIGEKEPRINVSEAITGRSEWIRLSSYRIAIPIKTIIELKAYDTLNNTIANITITDLRTDKPYTLYLNASTLKISYNGEEKATLIIANSHNEAYLTMDLGWQKEIVLKRDTYIMRLIRNNIIVGDTIIKLKEPEYIAYIDNKMSISIVETNTEDVIYCSTEVEINNISDTDIYFTYLNFTETAKYIEQISTQKIEPITQNWANTKNKIIHELENPETILSTLNISTNGEIKTILYKNLENTEITIEYMDGRKEKHTTEYTMNQIIEILRENNITTLPYAQTITETFTKPNNIEYMLNTQEKIIQIENQETANFTVTIDLEQDTIEIDGLKNLLSNQIDTTLNIITSFSLVAKNTWIEHIYNKEAEVLLRIYPMQSYVYTNIEKVEEIYSIAYDIEKSDISITDPKGTKTYINLKTMILEIRGNQTMTIDTKDKTLTALTQTKYSGIHIEITNNKTIDAWNWIQNHTTARQITILDYYTGEKISNKQITLTVNGSKTMPDQQFITLKGKINIEITNLWNEKIYDSQTQKSKITIPIKTATLTIINNLKNKIETRIESRTTKIVSSLYICLLYTSPSPRDRG